MAKYVTKSENMFDLITKSDPTCTFRTGIDSVDELVGGKLRLGEIFEIAGFRHTAKTYLAHSILANILISYRDDEDSFRIYVYNYSGHFSTKLLFKLVEQQSSLRGAEILSLFNNIFVEQIWNRNDMISSLHKLSTCVNEKRMWACHKTDGFMTRTIVFISDVGSILHNTAFMGINGHLIQDRVFSHLNTLARAGAFILMPTLGSNWRRLIPQRLVLSRDPINENIHIAAISDSSARKIYTAKFRLDGF